MLALQPQPHVLGVQLDDDGVGVVERGGFADERFAGSEFGHMLGVVSHRRIKHSKHHTRTNPKPESSDPDPILAVVQRMRSTVHPNICFSMLLNAALVKASRNPAFTVKDRLYLYTLRASWGNWYPYAVEPVVSEGRLLSVEEEEMERNAIGCDLRDMILFSPGPCPWCENPTTTQTALPPAFRWHRKCLANAYAHDAARLGNEEQREWAAQIFKGTA